jgi:hypothetical protein
MGVLGECDEVAAKIFRGRVCSREEVDWAYVKHLDYHILRTYCTTAIGSEGKIDWNRNIAGDGQGYLIQQSSAQVAEPCHCPFITVYISV